MYIEVFTVDFGLREQNLSRIGVSNYEMLIKFRERNYFFPEEDHVRDLTIKAWLGVTELTSNAGGSLVSLRRRWETHKLSRG